MLPLEGFKDNIGICVPIYYFLSQLGIVLDSFLLLQSREQKIGIVEVFACSRRILKIVLFQAWI